MATIYRYRNKINGKGYTGQTCRDISIRDKEHLTGGGSKALKRAMAKYGKENFVREVIEDGILPELLNEREIYWIAHFEDFKNGYNMTIGGDGTGAGENHPRYGKKHSAEAIEKMSRTKKGKKLSVEHCKKLSESRTGKKNPMYGRGGKSHPCYGRKHTPNEIEKMSGENNPYYGKDFTGKNNPHYGKKHSAETRRKLSESMKGENSHMYGRAGENNPKTRPEYIRAKWFFFLVIAPMDIHIKEKRKQLCKEFSCVPQKRLYKWFSKWQREIELTTTP